MMFALLLLMSGSRVYETGSVVTLDTTSAVVPMTQFRRAVEIMQDRALLLEEVSLDSIRHQADSAALQHCQAGAQDLIQALDTLHVAQAATDAARHAAVDSAAVLAHRARQGYWSGVAVGGEIGAVAVLLVLLFR
jgi:hypothetical protein